MIETRTRYCQEWSTSTPSALVSSEPTPNRDCGRNQGTPLQQD
ncbi:unnamed protein product, partial [Nippostrongylus brasiliensis]|uniref:Uncharacterized protein n=1 Tax=Nippostrongylus brasiliensis TaxID=27835 RepID=A0A0N4XNV8_NIPBR